MFLSIYCNRDGTEHLRRIAPNESLDLRAMVRRWADLEGYSEAGLAPSFSEPGSHIPNGCGDWQAEIRYTKAPGAVCWTSEPFYMISEGE